MVGAPLRALVPLLLAVTLSGCLQGDPGKGEEIVPTCRNWIVYPGGAQVRSAFSDTVTSEDDFYKRNTKKEDSNGPARPVVSGPLEWHGQPLDQVTFDFHYKVQEGENSTQFDRVLYVQDGTLQMRVYRHDPLQPKGTGEELPIYDEAQGPVAAEYGWNFTSDAGRHWSIFNVTMRVSLALANGSPGPSGIFVDWFFFRDQDHDPETGSVAFMYYKAEQLYRNCGAGPSAAST